MVELQSDDIFVDSRMLAEWFPMDLQVDIAGLQIHVIGREPLPIAEREARAESCARTSSSRQDGDRDGYAQLETPPYRASIHAQCRPHHRAAVSEGQERFGRVCQFLQYLRDRRSALPGLRDLLWAATMSIRSATHACPSAARTPTAVWPVRLDVTEFTVGDVFTPQVPLISRQQVGRGAEISNFPLLRPTEFDRITLRGDLPLGWEVELYRNEVLLNFQLSRQDGLYEFVDVPLVYGLNILRLGVLWTPGPKARGDAEVSLVGAGLVRPGDCPLPCRRQPARPGHPAGERRHRPRAPGGRPPRLYGDSSLASHETSPSPPA